jgi:hypothetical protein
MSPLRIIGFVLLAAAAGCSRGPSETDAKVTLEAFKGTWRSTTASYEHLRLTVSPVATQPEAVGMRLAFSGVVWEGVGGIQGDSLVMFASTSSQSGTTIVAHHEPNGSLSVRAQSDAAQPLTLTFVREE